MEGRRDVGGSGWENWDGLFFRGWSLGLDYDSRFLGKILVCGLGFFSALSHWMDGNFFLEMKGACPLGYEWVFLG